MKPERLARSVIYKNPWVNLYIDRVRFPSGRVVEQHHLLDFETEAVAVVIENDRHDILFIRTYRYTTETIEWEIPAGNIELGESVLEAAQREILEESGYEVTNLELLYTYNPMNGISNKTFHIAKAKVSIKKGSFDRNEVEAVTWFTKKEVRSMIKNKVIKDGFTLTALLLHLYYQEVAG